MRKLLGVAFAGTFLVGLGLASAASADDKTDGPNFTFGASTSIVYDFNDPDPDSSFNGESFDRNPLSYANQEQQDESFNIDLVQLGINGSRGRALSGKGGWRTVCRATKRAS